MVAVGSLSGGLTQVISGGNFLKGVTQGFAVSLLNHALHNGKGEGGGEKDILMEEDAVTTGEIILKDLKPEELAKIKIISENDGLLITPAENRTYYGDGFIYEDISPEGNQIWFKVSAGGTVTIKSSLSLVVISKPQIISSTESTYHRGINEFLNDQFDANLSKYHVGWVENNGDFLHFAVTKFYSNR